MAEWTSLEWLGYATLWVAALILATDTGLRMSAELRPRSMWLLQNPYWGFAPLALLTIGALTFLWNEFHQPEKKRIEAPPQSGWHLSEAQWQKMQAGLHLSPDERYSFQINSAPSCDNCEQFAEKLRDTISLVPGWTTGGGPLVFTTPKWKRGLWIVTQTKDEPARAISVLDTAFSYAGIHLIHDSEPAMEKGSFVIIVARPSQ